MSSLLVSSPLNQVPFSDFVYPDNQRAQVHHGNTSLAEKENVFPVIDFSAPDLSKQLENAARNFGFFQLVNHGIDLKTIHEMETEANRLFGLPMQQKLLIHHSESSTIGYSYGGINKLRFWHEGFEVYDSPPLIQEISEKLWPACSDSSQKFSETILKYTESMRLIGFELMRRLATVLGAKPDAWVDHCSREHMKLRFNYYPGCPEPSLTLGMPPHFDKHVLTLLYQDTVGGLQVLVNGKWMGLKPIANALIVNIGNALQVLSNGAYTSMKHRVVANTDKPRLSIPYFMSPRPETVLEAPGELIDSVHPPKYRGVTYKEMVALVDSSRYADPDMNYMASLEIPRESR